MTTLTNFQWIGSTVASFDQFKIILIVITVSLVLILVIRVAFEIVSSKFLRSKNELETVVVNQSAEDISELKSVYEQINISEFKPNIFLTNDVAVSAEQSFKSPRSVLEESEAEFPSKLLLDDSSVKKYVQFELPFKKTPIIISSNTENCPTISSISLPVSEHAFNSLPGHMTSSPIKSNSISSVKSLVSALKTMNGNELYQKSQNIELHVSPNSLASSIETVSSSASIPKTDSEFVRKINLIKTLLTENQNSASATNALLANTALNAPYKSNKALNEEVMVELLETSL